MPYRNFRDSNGIDWSAWDVMPQIAERRIGERRVPKPRPVAPERRRAERRVVNRGRTVLNHGLSQGWLCFQGGVERRRLSPIPGDWPHCADDRLRHYCRVARPVPRSSLRLTAEGLAEND
jgi:hypothetical protein